MITYHGDHLTTAERRQLLYHNGYAPLPIRIGDKHPLIKDWNALAHEDRSYFCPDRWYNHPFCGIATYGLRLIDGDIDDPDLAEQLHRYIVRRVGCPPIRFNTVNPRRVYVFRAAEGMPRKLFCKNSTTEYGIDVLGDGQQCFCFGIHPKGYPHLWTRSPLEVAVADLPSITEDEVMELLDYGIALLEADRWTDHQRFTLKPQPAEKAGDKPAFVTSFGNGETCRMGRSPNDPTDLSRSPQTNATWPLGDLQAALEAIPTPAAYDDWFRISAAFYAASSGSQEAFEMWAAWSTCSRDYAIQKWRTALCDMSITAGTLVFEARRHIPDWQQPSSHGIAPLNFFIRRASCP